MSSSPKERTLLVFGGTFDPPHRAHLTLPFLAAEAIGADHVLFVPAGCNPQKIENQPTSGAHRIAMLEAALADQPMASVSSIEIDREGASYMIDTLHTLHEMEAWKGTRMRLLIGADQALNFRTWRAWSEIITLAEPLVMPRGSQDTQALRDGLAALFPEDAEAWRGRVLDLPRRPDQSQNIRSDVTKERPIENQLTPEVENYVRLHDLYRQDGAAEA
jgi:nicotinate-nucleotide adenylyltransferase